MPPNRFLALHSSPDTPSCHAYLLQCWCVPFAHRSAISYCFVGLIWWCWLCTYVACVCVCECSHASAHACGGLRLASGVFFNCFLPYVLKQGLSLNWELSPGVNWLCLLKAGMRRRLPCTPVAIALMRVVGNLILSSHLYSGQSFQSHTCTLSALPSEPTPLPRLCCFESGSP